MKISDTSLTPQQAWATNDKTQFLLAANQALDGLLTGTPKLTDIDTYLTWYTSFGNDNDKPLADNHVLDWLFVTKCTLAVYGHSLTSILQSTLPLSESLVYWDTIYGNPWYEVYYGLQSNLFPMALRTNTTTTTMTNERPGKTLVQVFRKLYHSPLPLALLHDEIQQKRFVLRSFRTYQATTLGLLIKQAPRLNSSGDDRWQTTDDKLGHVVRGTSQCIRALTSCLLLNKENDSSLLHQCSNTFSVTSSNPYQVANDLKKVVDRQPTSQHYLDLWKKDYGPPSRLTRYWIPGLMIFFGGKMAVNYLFERKEDIMTWTKDGIHTIQEFLVHWLWEPSIKVLDTIRFKDQRIGLSSKEGLKSDLESLERMVVEFAKDQSQLTDTDIAQLVSQVRDGDVSVVLRAYENEIKNPLRNAIQGDLIQALLIQVQKTKVDVDMAMQALDKLLKSNELNFAFLAVAPSMLLTYASFSWLKNIYQRRGGNRIRQLGQPLKDTLR
ncbi:ATP synthase regulation protein NCA2-domain-containing protein [Chlamydoabsidia padenii]|nr:ATP synthase regulation protein NCA2-domain-containing protein [Chlamydoabsidia padenii]